jgi:hypothetical protein
VRPREITTEKIMLPFQEDPRLARHLALLNQSITTAPKAQNHRKTRAVPSTRQDKQGFQARVVELVQ